MFTRRRARGVRAEGGERCCAKCAQPLRQQIQRSGAFSEYLVHQVLRLMIERCEALNLYVRGPRRELKAHLLWVDRRGWPSPMRSGKLPRVASG